MIAQIVEQAYSQAVYPVLLRLVGGATSLLPFALADALPIAAIVLCAAGIAGLRRRWRVDRRRALVWAAKAISLAGAGVYLAFLLLWGLNYRRQPLAQSLGLQPGPAPVEELAGLASELVAAANDQRADRNERDGVFRLARGVDPALAQLAGTVRPKPSLLSPVLARLGISGIFVPFTLEPLVNDRLPESEIPWSAAHEMAHAAGWAREDEANFLAWRRCRDHADPDFRYSGSLVASLYAVGAIADVAPDQGRAVAEARSPAVRRDIEAIRLYQARYEGRLARAGERVNDAYLRSQGDSRGVHSYGRMVDLLLAERRARRPLVRS